MRDFRSPLAGEVGSRSDPGEGAGRETPPATLPMGRCPTGEMEQNRPATWVTLFIRQRIRSACRWPCGVVSNALALSTNPQGICRPTTPRLAQAALRVQQTKLDRAIHHPPFHRLQSAAARPVRRSAARPGTPARRATCLAVRAHLAHHLNAANTACRCGRAGSADNAARRLLAQRLVRPLLVVTPAEHRKAACLRPQARRRRACRLILQRQVHPLVPTVLLRRAWIDPIRPAPKA